MYSRGPRRRVSFSNVLQALLAEATAKGRSRCRRALLYVAPAARATCERKVEIPRSVVRRHLQCIVAAAALVHCSACASSLRRKRGAGHMCHPPRCHVDAVVEGLWVLSMSYYRALFLSRPVAAAHRGEERLDYIHAHDRGRLVIILRPLFVCAPTLQRAARATSGLAGVRMRAQYPRSHPRAVLLATHEAFAAVQCTPP